MLDGLARCNSESPNVDFVCVSWNQIIKFLYCIYPCPS